MQRCNVLKSMTMRKMRSSITFKAAWHLVLCTYTDVLVATFQPSPMISGRIAATRYVLKDTALRSGSTMTAASANKYNLELDSKDGSLQLCDNKGQTVCLFAGMSPIWSAKPSDKNGVFLHSSHPTKASTFDTSLGKLSTCHRLLACARVTRYWMGPAFGTKAKDIPLDTQFLLFEVSEGGPYGLLLPLLDGDFRASISGNKSNEIICHEESGDESVLTSGTRALYVAVDDDPYKLLKDSFAAVAKETATFDTLDDENATTKR